MPSLLSPIKTDLALKRRQLRYSIPSCTATKPEPTAYAPQTIPQHLLNHGRVSHKPCSESYCTSELPHPNPFASSLSSTTSIDPAPNADPDPHNSFVNRENRVPHYQRLFQKHDGVRQWNKVSLAPACLSRYITHRKRRIGPDSTSSLFHHPTAQIPYTPQTH